VSDEHFRFQCKDIIQMRLKTFISFGAANLFRKGCTKFYQNRPSFIEDIAKMFWSLFFCTHCSVHLGLGYCINLILSVIYGSDVRGNKTWPMSVNVDQTIEMDSVL